MKRLSDVAEVTNIDFLINDVFIFFTSCCLLVAWSDPAEANMFRTASVEFARTTNKQVDMEERKATIDEKNYVVTWATSDRRFSMIYKMR